MEITLNIRNATALAVLDACEQSGIEVVQAVADGRGIDLGERKRHAQERAERASKLAAKEELRSFGTSNFGVSLLEAQIEQSKRDAVASAKRLEEMEAQIVSGGGEQVAPPTAVEPTPKKPTKRTKKA